jgi:hypothetical protein
VVKTFSQKQTAVLSEEISEEREEEEFGNGLVLLPLLGHPHWMCNSVASKAG